MKNKIKIFLWGIFLCPCLVYAWGDVDDEFRDQFQDMLTKQDLCHASKGYSLDTTFEDASAEYQKLMNCLFNDAMQESVNRMHADFRKTLNKVVNKSPRELKDITFETKDCSLQGIQASQARNGYDSLCETEGANPTIDENYSSCHVAETAMNEFCAYQEYLEWKKIDYKSFAKEYPTQYFYNDYNTRDVEIRNQKISQYSNELQKSKKAVDEMIYRYQKWEQGYRIHMWFISILESLKETRRMLNELKIGVYQFPDKFNYATSPACECVNACL